MAVVVVCGHFRWVWYDIRRYVDVPSSGYRCDRAQAHVDAFLAEHAIVYV